MGEKREETLSNLKILKSIFLTKEKLLAREQILTSNLMNIKTAHRVLPPIEPQIEDFRGHENIYTEIYEYYKKAKEEYILCQDLISKETYFKQEQTYNNNALQMLNQMETECNSFFPQKYYAHLDEIVELVESFRADSVKEALNILLQEEIIKKQYSSLTVLLDTQIKILQVLIEIQER